MDTTTLRYVIYSSISKTQSKILQKGNSWGVDVLERNRLEDFPGLLTWKYLFGGVAIPSLSINKSKVHEVVFLECSGMPSSDLLEYIK